MIRVVIDTNILVSALLQPQGLPAAVLMRALSGKVRLCVSDAVFAEYDEVIRRPRFKQSPDVIEGTLQSIRKRGYWVKPWVHVEARAFRVGEFDNHEAQENANVRRGDA